MRNMLSNKRVALRMRLRCKPNKTSCKDTTEIASTACAASQLPTPASGWGLSSSLKTLESSKTMGLGVQLR